MGTGTAPTWARQVVVPAERLTRWLDGFAARHGAWDAVVDATGGLLVSSPDGALAGLKNRWRAPEQDPPGSGSAFIHDLIRPRTIGVLIARRRSHAVGVFTGSDLVRHHVGRHYVQGRTKAGGWSQQRYARRRDNQVNRSAAGAAADAEELLIPVVGGLDAFVTGGDRALLAEVLATPGLSALAALRTRNRHPVYPVADPNLEVLRGFGVTVRSIPISLNEAACT